MTDSVTITGTFPATRDQVCAMWTKPEHFSVWFGKLLEAHA